MITAIILRTAGAGPKATTPPPHFFSVNSVIAYPDQ